MPHETLLQQEPTVTVPKRRPLTSCDPVFHVHVVIFYTPVFKITIMTYSTLVIMIKRISPSYVQKIIIIVNKNYI